MRKAIVIFIITLVLPASGYCNSSYASVEYSMKGSRDYKVNQIKTREILYVPLAEEDPEVVKKISDPQILAQYKAIIADFNTTLRNSVTSLHWKYQTKIEFKYVHELYEMYNQGIKAVVIYTVVRENLFVPSNSYYNGGTMNEYKTFIPFGSTTIPGVAAYPSFPSHSSTMSEDNYSLLHICLIEDFFRVPGLLPTYSDSAHSSTILSFGLHHIIPTEAEMVTAINFFHWWLDRYQPKHYWMWKAEDSAKVSIPDYTLAVSSESFRRSSADFSKIYPYKFEIVKPVTFDSIINNSVPGYIYFQTNSLFGNSPGLPDYYASVIKAETGEFMTIIITKVDDNALWRKLTSSQQNSYTVEEIQVLVEMIKGNERTFPYKK